MTILQKIRVAVCLLVCVLLHSGLLVTYDVCTPRLRDSRLWDFVPCQGPTSVYDYIKVRLYGHCLVTYSSFS